MSIHFAPGGYDRGHLARGADEARGGALPVARIQAQDEIGVGEDVLHHAQVERVAAGEVERGVDVVDRRAERLGQLHQGVEALRIAADELGQDDRPLGLEQHVRGRFQRSRVAARAGSEP